MYPSPSRTRFAGEHPLRFVHPSVRDRLCLKAGNTISIFQTTALIRSERSYSTSSGAGRAYTDPVPQMT